jgi:H+/gluconate symporter-like permease
MNPAVVKALTMMGIALPTMFAVIAIFYVATKALHKAFPAPAEEEGEEDDED